MYESETHSWSVANGGKEFVVPYNVQFCDGVYWNGKIHWIRPKGDSYYFDLDKDYVVQCVGIPVQIRWWSVVGKHAYSFGNSNGHLHFVTNCTSSSPEGEFRFVAMEADCSRWLFKYCVDFSDVSNVFPEVRKGMEIGFGLKYYGFCVLGMVRGEEDEDAMLVFNVPGKVAAIKFKDTSFAELTNSRDFGFPCSVLHFGRNDACEFIETLAPV